MFPNFIFDKTKLPIFNPIHHVDGHNYHFPPPEIFTSGNEQLPPLEDNSPVLVHANQQFEHHDLNTSLRPVYPERYHELLSSYQSKLKRFKDIIAIVDDEKETEIESDGKLSTVDIIELAAEKFIKFSTQKVNSNGYMTMFTNPYGSSLFSGLSIDDNREVELVFQLLTAAERVDRKQFEIASKFLARCGCVASDDGTPVERLVFYLCEALQKRIGKETGIMAVPTKLKKPPAVKETNPMAVQTNMTFLAVHQAIPFTQVMQFAGIQAIIDQVGMSKKVHLIDIHIQSGIHWAALMQASSEKKSQIELLKLTAFATLSDIQKVGETGKRLEAFAATLNLPFVFKVLFLTDISNVEEQQFEVEDGETIAVYCQMILRRMIWRPEKLENLIRAIKTINPSIIVLVEVEANHNSTSFVKRFTETLFFYGAMFDSLEACMSRDDAHRAKVESNHLAVGMQNIVACEGDERNTRNVNIDTWRSFFMRFGMVEMDLSESCLHQANLVLQQFSCGSFCTLENNGKCLIVGWKGIPVHSLSTWKFIEE
uniref:DELLA protein RGL1-like n=1 Tax=Erigeron canadensis TaxID=72917 RepID=UPI001CB9A90A|nr:DELLA protein RGL1-like [Erigeron canadensis]